VTLVSCGQSESNWRYVLSATKIKLPEHFSHSPVNHPTEVVFTGTIQLDPTGIAEFISANSLKPLADEAKRDDFRALSYLARDFSSAQQGDKYVLFGNSASNRWEFLLDVKTSQVRYHLLCQDYSGDVPR
jgi:hypothetical protein